MATILIKGGRVFDGERFLYKDVLIDNGIIVAINESISVAADTVYDATGKTVSAGLVDAHTHLRGISCEKYGTQAEMSCFPFGVTSAADGGCCLGDRALLDSFMLKAVVFISVNVKNNIPNFEAVDELLKKYGDAAVGLKMYLDSTTDEVEDISPLKQICDKAHSLGLRVMVHCSNSPVKMAHILDTLGKGDILTHVFHGGINRADEDGFECVMRAKERGVIIDVGMAGHVHTDFAVMKKAIECGVFPNVISTDVTRLSAYVRGGRYGMTMCMSIARHLGMCEKDIFRAVTLSPARALGKSDLWGRLGIGRAADIAVLKYTDEGFDLTDRAGNRIQSDKGYRCVMTVSGGQIVYKY